MSEDFSATSTEMARTHIDAQLRQSFVHLKANGVSLAMLDEFEVFLQAPGTLLRPALIIRCQVIDGSIKHSIVVDNPKMRWRLSQQFLPFLDRVRQRLRGNADVFVLLSDTMYVADTHAQRCVEFLKRVPLLRGDWLEGDPISSHSIAIPDFSLQEASYGADIDMINEVVERVPFSDRQEVIKWRGRLSGPGYPDADNCHLFPRYHLLKLAAMMPSVVDARITHYKNFPDTESARALKQELDNLLSGPAPEIAASEFVFYKYLISIDGAVSAWKRVPNSLWTGSTLLLQHQWKQFFYPGLVAWQHYVPIADDLSDLFDRYAWLRAHPAHAERIGREGRRFAEANLTINAIENYFVAVLESCAALPRVDDY